MLTSKKSYIFLFIASILLTIIPNICLATVSPTNDFYVNDYANILNEETKQYIINCNKDLYNKTGAQIVIVTVQNLEGKVLEEYATQLFREFGIGNSKKNNGVLLLLALEERQFRVEVGYGLEGALPDGKTGGIQDEYIIPYLKENNWNDGIKNGFNAILKVVSEEYNVQIDNSAEPIKGKETKIIESLIPIIIMIIIIIIIKKRGGGFYGGYFGRRRFFRRRFFFTEVDFLQEVEVLHGGGGSSRSF